RPQLNRPPSAPRFSTRPVLGSTEEFGCYSFASNLGTDRLDAVQTIFKALWGVISCSAVPNNCGDGHATKSRHSPDRHTCGQHRRKSCPPDHPHGTEKSRRPFLGPLVSPPQALRFALKADRFSL